MMAALTVVATIAAGCGGSEQTQTAASPSPLARERVEVAAVDFAFEGVPETLEAGETTFVLTNEGEVGHEMTLGLLPAGWTIEEVALGSSDSGTKIVGVIEPIEPGASGEMTVELEPGTYGYICGIQEVRKARSITSAGCSASSRSSRRVSRLFLLGEFP